MKKISQFAMLFTLVSIAIPAFAKGPVISGKFEGESAALYNGKVTIELTTEHTRAGTVTKVTRCSFSQACRSQGSASALYFKYEHKPIETYSPLGENVWKFGFFSAAGPTGGETKLFDIVASDPSPEQFVLILAGSGLQISMKKTPTP